ncbi:MAG: PAS domain S-box protein [Bacteroidota bacterium]
MLKILPIFQAADNVAFILTDVSKDKLIIEFSPGAEKSFGYTKHQVIGKPVEILHQPGNEQILNTIYRKIIKKGQNERRELNMRKNDDRIFPVLFSTFALCDEKNDINAILQVCLDVTEQKEHEEQLVESQKRYQHLVETSPIPILVYTNDKIVFINNMAIEVLGGHTREDFTGQPFWKFIHEDYKKYYESGDIPLEQKFFTVDRRVILVEVKKNNINFLGNHSCQLAFQDITDKKETENALIENEKKFRNIFNSTNDAIVILNNRGQFIEANEAACHYIGYSKEEFLKLSFPEIMNIAVTPENFHERMSEIKKNIQNVREVEIITKNKVVLNVELSSRHIIYRGEECILSIAREISERKNLERKILNTIIETEEKERERFARDLHDGLGPLLSTIKLYLRLLTRDNDIIGKEKLVCDSFEMIDEAIQNIKLISNNISPHILNDFGLKAAISSFCKKLNIPNYMRINFSSNINETRFDKNVEIIIYRIIKEMINNTMRHSSANKLNIKLNLDNDYLKIQYSDNGIGFDGSDFLSRKSKGVGFFNINNRLKSINGKMQVNSQLGKGVHIEIQVKL